MTSSTGVFTYWSLLGISPDSNSEELKKAFRKEAMRWHPDLNKNSRAAEERFKWINEAYKVLSDPKKRFEWEIAGKPTFEIKDIRQETPTRKLETNDYGTKKGHYSFNTSEKLLLLIISIITFFCIDNLTL